MNKRGLIFVLCCLLVAVNAEAQSQVNEAIDRFVEYCGENVYTKSYRTPKQIPFYRNHAFDLPDNKKNENALKELIRSFKASQNESYSYREQNVDTTLIPYKWYVPYGVNNEQKKSYFYRNDINFIVSLAKDSTDATKRYCYALAWYKREDRLRGFMDIIYGKDPQLEADKPAKIEDVLEVRVTKDDVFSNFFPTLEQLKEEARKSGKLKLNIATASAAADTVVTDMDFLRRFGNLRGTLIEQRYNPTVGVSFANKLLELCKNHAYLVDEETRMVCSRELDRMIKDKVITDPYVQGLLARANKYLKEAKKPKQ